MWVSILYTDFDKEKFTEDSGIYRFHSVANDASIELYIGKSKNLKKRVLSHNAFLKKLFLEFGNTLHISYMQTDDLEEKEKIWICKLKPKYNRAYNYQNFKITNSISKQIFSALDGRKRRWLSFEVKIAEQDLYKKINGFVDFTDDELTAIETRLNFKFKKQ